MKQIFQKYKFFLIISTLLLSSCSKGDDIIQTVPATNNPHMIIDSNRSPFMPNMV